TELVDEAPVLGLGHLSDTGGRTTVDIAEQAGPTQCFVASKHSRRTGSNWEDPGQGFQGLPDRPGLRVRPEVAHALATRPTVEIGAREPILHADGQHRVRLIVRYMTLKRGLKRLIHVYSRLSASNSLPTTVHCTRLAVCTMVRVRGWS